MNTHYAICRQLISEILNYVSQRAFQGILNKVGWSKYFVHRLFACPIRLIGEYLVLDGGTGVPQEKSPPTPITGNFLTGLERD